MDREGGRAQNYKKKRWPGRGSILHVCVTPRRNMDERGLCWATWGFAHGSVHRGIGPCWGLLKIRLGRLGVM